jgi:L-iditol 2-dehydrogenase
MRAAVLVKLGRIEIQERPLPEPGPGEVRIKVAAVGVCGSDVHYYREGRIGNAVVKFPSILGHEPAGVVDAAGPGVKHLKAGMRVAVEPGVSCMKCESCLAGRFNCCPHVKFLASPPVDGIYQQYRCMPEHACIPMPDRTGFVEAAMLEPVGVGLHAVKLARLEVGETVGVFGSGPIGLVTILAARLAGTGRIYATDLVPERLKAAREYGADETFDAGKGDPVAWLKERTGGRGVDAAFEAGGVQDTVTHACLGVRVGGRAHLIGIPAEDELTIPMHECRRRELAIQHVRRSNGEILPFLRLVEAGRVDLKRLATHFFPLEKINEAFDLVHRKADGVIRAVIQPNADLAEA